MLLYLLAHSFNKGRQKWSLSASVWNGRISLHDRLMRCAVPMSTVNNVNTINYRIHITAMTCHFHGNNTVNRSQSKLGSGVYSDG